MSESMDRLDFYELMTEADLSGYAKRQISRIEEIVEKDDSGLTAWEGKFLASLVRQFTSSGALTVKQQSKLDGIYEERIG